MEYFFILTEPAVPENIGAAARAIKTMGFSALRLVNPANHLADEAKWLAHASNDILESATVYKNLDDAIADLDFVIATTAKSRSSKFDYYTPEEAKRIAKEKGETIKTLGIVFGREESGLTNKEVKLCDIASTIPLATTYPSINLAQSVMVFAYVFSQAEKKQSVSINKHSNYTLLKDQSIELMESIGIDKSSNLFGRIVERIATLKDSDINLVLSVLNKLKKK